MAEPSPIASSDAALRPLGAGGQRVVEAYPQIAAHLRRARSPAHAALFAQPVPDRDRAAIDWYAEGTGEAVPLDRLDAAERETAEQRLAALLADVEAEATALQESPREGDRLLGDMLRLAMRVPDRSWVRVRGGQPMLVGWGHEIGGQSIGPELLTRPTERRPGPMAVLMPPVAAPRAWPRWLPWWLAALLALLLLLLLLLLWRDPWRWFALAPPACIAEPTGLAVLDERRREEARTAALRAELAGLQLEAGQARLACPPIRRQAAAPPQPEPPRPNEDLERARREGAREGNVQVVLAWDDRNDLDLAVICPDGTRIFFENRRGCGAELDVDMNVAGGPRPITAQPVENITWAGDPPAGQYRIEVTNYARNPGGPAVSPFRVTIRRPGQPDQVLRGQARPNQTVAVGGFRWPP